MSLDWHKEAQTDSLAIFMTSATFATDRKLNYSSGSLKKKKSSFVCSWMCAWYLYESWHSAGTDTHMPVCAGAQACGVHMCTCMWRLEIYIRCLPNNAPLVFLVRVSCWSSRASQFVSWIQYEPPRGRIIGGCHWVRGRSLPMPFCRYEPSPYLTEPNIMSRSVLTYCYIYLLNVILRLSF